MLDTIGILNERIEYWQNRDLDCPYLLNGFRGEFAFSDHSLVPEMVRNLVMTVTRYERFRSVPIEEINAIAREVHGGEPGFCTRALERIRDHKLTRNTITSESSVYEPTLSIDDWTANTGESNAD